MGIKNAEFAADFESVKKSCKKHAKKLPTMEFLTVCKTFRPIYFTFFALFAMDSRSAQICVV